MSAQGALQTSGATWAAARPRVMQAGALSLAVMLLASLVLLLGAGPAHAAARVDVSPMPNADGSTTVTLSGSGFQYQPNAPGGVYVFFGAVNEPSTNSWAPSQGGRSGESFAYAATGGARLLIAFQGGASAEAANGMIDSSGSWSTQMTVPGSKFTATFGDPHSNNQQSGQEIDCLEVQCGIITIGAHGQTNANNESFTPVSFATASGEVRSGSGSVQEFGGSAQQSNNDDATTLDVPGEEAEGETADEEEGVAAAPGPAENAVPEGISTPTLMVLGVLAFALLALIVAIALVLVKRARAKKAAAAAAAVDEASTAEEGAPTEPGEQEPEAQARVPEEVGR